MADTDISELLELGAEKVSGVGNPANGTPWLLRKAADNSGVHANPESPHTESLEADEQEEQMTKAEADEIEMMLTKARMGGFCGVDDCGACKEQFGPLLPALLAKAKLKESERSALPKSQFAYVDAAGVGHLPIHDKAHADNALSRFNQTHFESAEAKAKAGRKIRAKAKSFGIDVSPEANVNKQEKKSKVEKSPGVPDESVATPKEHGHLATGQSGLTGGMTAGERANHVDPSRSVGGESSYEIPTESKITNNPPAPAPIDAVKEEWTVEITESVEKQNWITLDESTEQGAESPGSPQWEDRDAATLDSAANGLAGIGRALTEIRNREMVEAISGDSSDWYDAFKLECAHEDVCSALGLVAALAYHERAEGTGVEKAGRRLSGKSEGAIRTARDHLSELLGEGNQADTAGNGGRPSEEESIMATVTKEELDAQVATTAEAVATKAVKAALKAERKLAAKKAKKKAKKMPPFMTAEKNANNGGDVTAQHMEGQVHGHHDANDINAVPNGGHVDGQYVNKVGRKLEKTLERLAKSQAETTALVEKMAGRPRSGGPVLDGQQRGAFPASDGRQTETVTKGAEEGEITRLEKSLEESKDAMHRDQISRALTLARLRKGHEDGVI